MALLDKLRQTSVLLLTVHTPLAHKDNPLAPAAIYPRATPKKKKLTNLKAEVRVSLTEHHNYTISLNPGQLQGSKK